MVGGWHGKRGSPRIRRLWRTVARRSRRRLRAAERARAAAAYGREGRRPFSPGYWTYRWGFINRVLSDEAMLDRFQAGEPLPAGHGRFLDERVVEYPWLLSRLRGGRGRLLDAGSILNHRSIISHPALAGYDISIFTLAPEGAAFWRRGVSYLYGDMRELPFRDDYFDQVVCVSSLEHVGMDNTLIYTKDRRYQESRKTDYLLAAAELRRVLKPGGRCLLTVPFGRYQDDGFQQQFDDAMLERLREVLNPAGLEETYFRYTPAGWELSDRRRCGRSRYFNIHRTKYFDPDSDRGYDPDLAAAARAAAAWDMTK